MGCVREPRLAPPAGSRRGLLEDIPLAPWRQSAGSTFRLKLQDRAPWRVRDLWRTVHTWWSSSLSRAGARPYLHCDSLCDKGPNN